MPIPEPDHGPDPHDSLLMRLLASVIIAVMLSIAQTILYAMTVVQFILILTRRGRPNVELAWAGKRLGDWQAKSARYLTGADDEKPWPWSPLD